MTKMKNKVVLHYKRPKRIEENAEWQKKDYTYYSSSFSTAMDGCMRLALAGYATRIEINGVVVLDWAENFINENYKL